MEGIALMIMDLAGMNVAGRHEAAASLMEAGGLTLKQAYRQLVLDSTLETRLLAAEERRIWAAALSEATDLALSISPFLSLLRPAYTTGIAGLAVDDGYRLMVGPWFFDPGAAIIRPTLLLHEALHPLLGHKAKQLAVETALIAGDCQINQGLRWNPWLDWPRRADWTVEAVFPEDVKTPGYPDGLPEKKDYGWYYNELSKLDPEAQSAVSASVDGLKCDGPLTPEQSASMDELGIAPAAESEVAVTRQRAMSVAEGAENGGYGRAAGRGAGSQWDDWARAQLKPSREPWQRTIARAARKSMDGALEAGAEEKSTRRADRREWEDDPSMIRRGWVDPEVNVAVVLDVSDSMDSDMLTAMSELEAALRACDGARVTIVTADDGVRTVQTVESIRGMGRIQHGGGTMLAPAVGWLASSLDPKPSMVIIITDGGLGDWGDMEEEIRHGALAKRTEFLFVFTDKWGSSQMPASLRAMRSVDAWTISGDDGSNVRYASSIGKPTPGEVIDGELGLGD